jgi:hypothetical protein
MHRLYFLVTTNGIRFDLPTETSLDLDFDDRFSCRALVSEQTPVTVSFISN